MTTVVTLHLLDMAARFADEIVVLSDGEVYATGQPSTVLTTDMLGTVYQVKIHWLRVFLSRLMKQ